jgi:hypothetical protein
MPKLSQKHFNQEAQSFVDFSGGLNLSKPPEAIGMDEMQAAVNFEFAADTGLLKVRGGLESQAHFDYPIRDIFPIAGGNAALVRAGDFLYRLLDGNVQMLGEVDGDMPGAFEYYGNEGNVAMVFGGHVHLYKNADATMMRVVSVDCPTAANAIFYREGRIAVTQTSSAEIRYSAIGDPEQWVHDPDNARLAQFIEVGYNDGCTMAAIGNMVGETIVFKCPPGQPDNGRIYRLQGSVGTTSWRVVEHSKGASAWNSSALTVVSNNMLFITREGMSSLATAMEFGDYRLSWAGAKVNPKISLSLTDNCRLWHMPIKGQVWLWDGVSSNCYIYHYQIGSGAWTTFAFPAVPGAVAAVNNRVLVGLGNTVYELNESTAADNIYNPETEETEVIDIAATWMPKTLVRANEILVKQIHTNYLSTGTSEPQVDIEGFKVPLPMNGQGADIAAADTDIAAADTDTLVPSKTSTVRVRCNIRKWNVTPKIEVKNGLFSLQALHLYLAEI